MANPEWNKEIAIDLIIAGWVTEAYELKDRAHVDPPGTDNMLILNPRTETYWVIPTGTLPEKLIRTINKYASREGVDKCLTREIEEDCFFELLDSNQEPAELGLLRKLSLVAKHRLMNDKDSFRVRPEQLSQCMTRASEMLKRNHEPAELAVAVRKFTAILRKRLMNSKDYFGKTPGQLKLKVTIFTIDALGGQFKCQHYINPEHTLEQLVENLESHFKAYCDPSDEWTLAHWKERIGFLKENGPGCNLRAVEKLENEIHEHAKKNYDDLPRWQYQQIPNGRAGIKSDCWVEIGSRVTYTNMLEEAQNDEVKIVMMRTVDAAMGGIWASLNDLNEQQSKNNASTHMTEDEFQDFTAESAFDTGGHMHLVKNKLSLPVSDHDPFDNDAFRRHTEKVNSGILDSPKRKGDNVDASKAMG